MAERVQGIGKKRGTRTGHKDGGWLEGREERFQSEDNLYRSQQSNSSQEKL